MADTKKIPEFKSEAEEFEFWSTADSAEYFDWSKAKQEKFEKLRPEVAERQRQERGQLK